MGFSGGGSNVLKNHKHDATVVQDGGSLDADNVTSADLTAGDVIYSDGAHLQRLGIGSVNQALTSTGAVPQWSTLPLASSVLTTAGDVLIMNNTPALARLGAASNGDVLTLAAGLPSWAAASGGIWNAAGFDSAVSLQSNLEVTGMTGKDIYQIIYNVAGDNSTGAQLSFTLNGITTSTYNTALLGMTSGVPGSIDRDTGIAHFTTDRATSAASRSGIIYIYTGDSNFSSGGNNGVNWRGYNTSNAASGDVDYLAFCSGGNDTITGAITSIQVFLSSGDIMGNIQVNSMNYQ